MDVSFIFPSFIAGLFTFLAPCTLPLVPSYLCFISGVSANTCIDSEKIKMMRARILLNGVLYTLGFSTVFVFFGAVFGFGGSSFSEYRMLLFRIGGALIIFFGLSLTGIFHWSFLDAERRLKRISALKPGHPFSSVLFGMIFAFGWTPCIGPVLGSILTLAAISATATEGALLLLVFSLGLALPFILLAAMIGLAFSFVARILPYLRVISIVSGVFLVFLGILLTTNTLYIWTSIFYKVFGFLNFTTILDYL